MEQNGRTKKADKIQNGISPAKIINLNVILTIGILLLLAAHNILMRGIDSDTWFILSNGRYILQNGFPKTNPFVFHEGLPIVLSQPLTSVLLFLVYKNLGYQGLLLWTYFFTALSTILLFKLTNKFLKNKFLAIMLTVIYSFSGFMDFWNTRPQLLTISLLIIELIVLENIKREKKLWQGYLILPIISLISINVHGSFFAIIFLPVIAFLAGEIILSHKPLNMQKKCIKIQSDFFIKLLPCVLCMLLMGFLNPYRIDGILYLFRSAPIATKYTFINELAPPKLACNQTYLYLAESMIGILYVIKCLREKRSINTFHLFLWLGGNLLYPMAIRNILLSSLFSIPFICDYLFESQNAELFSKIRFLFAKLYQKITWTFLLTICLGGLLIYCPNLFSTYYLPQDKAATPIRATEYLLQNSSEKRVYTSFNNGAFVQWQGAKVFIDARPELYETKECSIYSDCFTIYTSRQEPKEFLEKYQFDYLIVADNSRTVEIALRSFLEQNKEYSPVLEGNGYVLWEKCL